MKGDFSRVALDASKFSRVLAQQGRIQLDADWNEQQAIIDYRLRSALSDLFGHGGLFGLAVVPRARAGFAIHLHQGAQFHGDPAGISAAMPLEGFEAKPYTIDLWIRTVAEGGSDPVSGTLVRGADFRIAIDAHGNLVFTRTLAASDYAPARTVELVSRGPLRCEGYTFISCVVASGAMEIWIDGTLDRRRSAGVGLRPASQAAGTIAVGEGYHGAIEQIAFWRKRRYRDHIEQSFLSYDGTGAVPDGFVEPDDLAGRWRYDDPAAAALPRSSRDVCVGPGRCYVDGRLCENPNHRMVTVDAATLARARASGSRLVAYVDVWECYVSAYEDASLRDVALGGLDTSGRTRTVAQTWLLLPSDFDADEAFASNSDRGEIALAVGNGILQDNLLYRFEVHEAGFAARDRAGDDEIAAQLRDPADRSNDGSALLALAGTSETPAGQYLQIVDPPGHSALLRVLGREQQDAQPGEPATTLLRVADAPSELLGRALRVRAIASMLWSRQNGNLVFAVDKATPATQPAQRFSTVVLRDEAARGGELQIGDVVVLSDPARSDNLAAGFVTSIVDSSVDVPGAVTLTVQGEVPVLGAGATLRKWDGILPIDARNGSPPVSAGDLNVRFAESGYYRSGDYWHAAVRPDGSPPLDWARDQSGSAVFLPPLGIEHTYAPLAWVSLSADGYADIEDMRRIVPAVGDLTTSIVPAAPEPPPASGAAAAEPSAVSILNLVPPQSAPAPAFPPGALLLARTTPPGFTATGSVVDARVEQPRWRADRPAPEGGQALAASIEGIVYALYERGTLVRRDPAHPDNPWEACRPYDGVRTAYALVAFDGKLYLIGGYEPQRRPSRAVAVYDPRTDLWTQAPPMRIARAHPIVAATSEGIFVGGGRRRTWFGYRYSSQRAERFDGEGWDELRPMPFRRHAAAAVVRDAAMYVLGGVVMPGVLARREHPSRDVDRWHLRTGVWTRREPLHEPRFAPQAVALGEDEIVVAGGGADDLGAERYGVRTDAWRRLDMPARSGFGLVSDGGTLSLIAGASAGTDRPDVQTCTLIDRLSVYRPQEASDGI